MSKDKTPYYTPSRGVLNKITLWEGSSMYAPAPDTGKVNRSFEEMIKDFNNTVPKNTIKEMPQGSLDALFSYFYNVGAGNFKKRLGNLLQYYGTSGAVSTVVPRRRKLALEISQAMTATKDVDYRGLYNRRNFERNAFLYGLGYKDGKFGTPNKVDWESDDTDIPGYVTLLEWNKNKKGYNPNPKNNGWNGSNAYIEDYAAFDKERLLDQTRKYLNTPIKINQQETYVNPVIGNIQSDSYSSSISPVYTLTTEDKDKNQNMSKDKDIIGAAIFNLNDYAQNQKSQAEHIMENIYKLPDVKFNSKQPDILIPNYDYDYGFNRDFYYNLKNNS